MLMLETQSHQKEPGNFKLSKLNLLRNANVIMEILSLEFINHDYITMNELDTYLEIMIDDDYLSVNDDEITIKNNKRAYRKMLFMKNLVQSFIDTYYIVLSAINTIIELGNNQIELSYIEHDLHHAIKEIYYQGAIQYMDSCLIETIRNSFYKFT